MFTESLSPPGAFQAQTMKISGLFKEEKPHWFSSFLIAAGLHILILWGGKYGFGLITPPEYGMMGSYASIDVYMVAALPQYAKNPDAKAKEDQETTLELIEAPSEMMIPQKKKEEAQKKSEAPKGKDEDKLKTAVKEKSAEKGSEFKGDGSSPVPGQSVTTLYSRASSETDGKAGKYQNPPPQYPAIAERNGWEGVVILKAYIPKEGRPEKLLIEKSSGHQVLDMAALRTVKKWRFTAGRLGKMEVATWITIPIRFDLEDKKVSA